MAQTSDSTPLEEAGVLRLVPELLCMLSGKYDR
jgi:hypothetical protein